MKTLLASLRLVAATLVVCCVVYPAILLAFAQLAFPENANGRLVRSAGGVVGSRSIAQAFSSARYFWPRPSAVDYNAAAAGGSNKSPTSPVLARRAREVVARYGATAERPLPADLATASGSGLDPHITEAGALYQVERVSRARRLDPARVQALVAAETFAAGGAFAPERIVNVLDLNLALDRLSSSP